MPKVSTRGIAMPESPIRKLAGLSVEAQKKGKRIISLNIGQPDVLTPEVALNSLKNYDEKVIGYSPSDGFESTREALANFYKRHQVYEAEKEDVLITVGGSEALNFTMAVITQVGDEIITPEPFFSSYNSFSIAQGIKLVTLPSYLKDGFSLPKVADFKAKITSKTRAILLCNPGNPAGNLYTKSELEAIKDLAIEKDLFLIADEVYREFIYEGESHTSILSFTDAKDRTIVIDSMSKRFSMCGVRVGAIVTKNRAVLGAALKYAQARLSPPSLGQYVSEVALNETSPTYFQEVKQTYLERRDFLVKGLKEIDGAFTVTPKGAFYCMVDLPVDDADKYAAWLISEFDIDGDTVMMAPASGFYTDKTLAKKQLRIAYVLKIEELEKALRIIKESLKIYPGRTN